RWRARAGFIREGGGSSRKANTLLCLRCRPFERGRQGRQWRRG
ncbi:unnamed protein product, partial [Ascophyllum nodosum]